MLHGTKGMGCAAWYNGDGLCCMVQWGWAVLHGIIDGHTCGVYKIVTVNDGRGL